MNPTPHTQPGPASLVAQFPSSDAVPVVKAPRVRRVKDKAAASVSMAQAPAVVNPDASEFSAPKELGADTAFGKGSATMKSQVKERLGSANQTVKQFQEGVLRSAQTAKNTAIGAMLVFMANLPQFFEPILFVMSNSKTLGKAALHVLAPLALAWYAAQISPVLRDSLFSSPGMGMKLLGSVSLYALSSFTWMLGWMFTSSVFRGVGGQLDAFAQVGEQQQRTA